MCPCCPWLVLAPRVFQLCTNHLVWVVCKPMWVHEAYQLFLVPSRSSNMPLYLSKCCELGSVPRLLLLPLFSTWTHIWVVWGVGSASFLTHNYAIEVLKPWLPSFCWRKELTQHLIHQCRILEKENNPPMQPCAFIILYSNVKLLKTLNNLTTLEYPWWNS
jgi:hypothetical protein